MTTHRLLPVHSGAASLTLTLLIHLAGARSLEHKPEESTFRLRAEGQLSTERSAMEDRVTFRNAQGEQLIGLLRDAGSQVLKAFAVKEPEVYLIEYTNTGPVRPLMRGRCSSDSCSVSGCSGSSDRMISISNLW